MKKPGNNPFMLIIIGILLLLLSQTVAAFGIVLLNGGHLFADGMTVAEADAAMLELMFEHQTEILLVSYVMVLAVLWWMARRRELSLAAFTGLQHRTNTAISVLALAAGLAAAFWASIAINMIPWPEAWLEAYQTESGALTTARPLLDFIAIVLLAPMVEEMLFRGVIYNAFCMLLPAGAAVFFQGVLFGSVHGAAIWILYATFMGCVLGYVRKHTGSVRPCVLMHMAFNGSSYLFSWFASQYSEDSATVIFVFLASAFVLLLSMYGISFRTSEETQKKD